MGVSCIKKTIKKIAFLKKTKTKKMCFRAYGRIPKLFSLYFSLKICCIFFHIFKAKIGYCNRFTIILWHSAKMSKYFNIYFVLSIAV